MKVLMIFNHAPYDGTDITWNALRQANTLLKNDVEVRIFLMNDSVDMARASCKAPAGYEFDLSQMLRDLIAQGVAVRVCSTCMARCGLYKNEPYCAGANTSSQQELAEWIIDSDKVLTF